MGWGQVPGEVKAAEEAARKARELTESRPMSPFERRLIEVLEEIHAAVDKRAPVALEPIVGTVARTDDESLLRQYCGLDPLLDSPPDVLTRAINAGAEAMQERFPTMCDDYTFSGFEKMSEVVIEAALHEAARDQSAPGDVDSPYWRVGGPTTSAVQQSSGDEAGEGAADSPSPAAP